MKKNEESLRDLWDTTKQKNICVIVVPEGEERGSSRESILRNNGPQIPKSDTGMDTQIQEAQRTPTRINLKTYQNTSNCHKTLTKHLESSPRIMIHHIQGSFL